MLGVSHLVLLFATFPDRSKCGILFSLFTYWVTGDVERVLSQSEMIFTDDKT